MEDNEALEYDEVSLKLARAIIKINWLERENKELKRNLEELTKEKMYALRIQLK